MNLARIALGVVFLFAGAAKISDRGWVSSASEFGLSQRSAWVIPAVEILLGSFMLVGVGGSVMVWCAIALLVAFSIAIAIKLTEGRPVVCACFGGWSRRPLSWRSLGRNAFLIALAGAAIWVG